MDAAAYCESLVRDADRDRFLSILFAPADRRPHLFALAAFNVEVSRIRETVSQPAAGEIRLQWWREAIEGKRAEEAAAHPVAIRLIAAIRECALPITAFDRLLEARIFDLYDDPVPTLGDLEGYAGDTQSALIQLSAIVLGDGGAPPGDAAGHGGVAWTMAGVLRALPQHAARGQIFIPAEVLARNGAGREDILRGRLTPGLAAALAEMRTHAQAHYERSSTEIRGLPIALRPAFLHVALVPLYLKRVARPGFDPFREVADVAQWRRQIALWRAARG